MKPCVVFLHYHGVGHINPLLPLASILEKENYEVHFAGAEYFNAYVTVQGFSHYILRSVPFGAGFETWMNTIEKKKNIYFSSLSDRITDRLYRIRDASLCKMLVDLKPAIILIDSTQATDFIVLYPHLKNLNIRVGIVHAMFPTHVLPGRPPVNSVTFPDDKKNVSIAIRIMRGVQRRKTWTQKIKYLTFDDRRIIRRRLKQNQIPSHYCSEIPCLFNFSTNTLHEFVLAPREFDFPNFKVEPNQHYIGFMVAHPRQEHSHPEYFKIQQSIFARQAAQNMKLIYCSFGTVESDKKEIIFVFLKRLINVVRNENLLLIISMKTSSGTELFIDEGDPIYLFKSVPQPEVLAKANVFITHGGLSSIKEAIDAEVPMLMYPVHDDYDPKGNSARVAYHGMGLLGDAEKDSEEEIQRKINTVLKNEVFRQNVLEMKRKNSGYTAEKFLALFNTLPSLEF